MPSTNNGVNGKTNETLIKAKLGRTKAGAKATASTTPARRNDKIPALRSIPGPELRPPWEVATSKPNARRFEARLAALDRSIPTATGKGSRGRRRSKGRGSKPASGLAKIHSTKRSRCSCPSFSAIFPGPTTKTAELPGRTRTCGSPQ